MSSSPCKQKSMIVRVLATRRHQTHVERNPSGCPRVLPRETPKTRLYRASACHRSVPGAPAASAGTRCTNSARRSAISPISSSASIPESRIYETGAEAKEG
jgi:hypothetical protein